MNQGCLRALFLSVVFGASSAHPGRADEVDESLAVIRKVGPQAAGSSEAREARLRLSRHGVEILPRLLDALDTPNIVAANWYRTVFEDIVEREFDTTSQKWPMKALQEFARQASRQGRARRLVLDLLERIEPGYRNQVLTAFLDDPEFRNDAVEWTIREGDRLQNAKDNDAAKQRYRDAFQHAREGDHVLLAARKLKEVGDPVDPVKHLGFVTRWFLLGPFDAPGTTGFDLKFPPEESVDLRAEFSGKDQATLKWKSFASDDSLGQVNLITGIGAVREAVGYAYAELHSPRQQAVQLRCSADDNLTVWLDGERVLAQRQWLNGTRLDRFVTTVTLKEGTNRVLVKICQGPQHVNPEVPNNWTFQLRFCDRTGASAGITSELPGEPE